MPTGFKKREQVPFLTGKERETWETKGVLFMILKCRTDKYEGVPRHVYTVAPINGKTGELGDTSLLAMNDNPIRLDVADDVMAALAEDPSGVGPCKLEKVEAKVQGGWVWSIEPADEA